MDLSKFYSSKEKPYLTAYLGKRKREKEISNWKSENVRIKSFFEEDIFYTRGFILTRSFLQKNIFQNRLYSIAKKVSENYSPSWEELLKIYDDSRPTIPNSNFEDPSPKKSKLILDSLEDLIY